MTTDTREAVKVHYIALTKPELVRATIRKQKDVTRRVIVRQNSIIGKAPETNDKPCVYLPFPSGKHGSTILVWAYPRWEPGSLLGIKETWAVSSFSQQTPGRLQICYRAGVTDDHPDGNDCDRLWRDVDMDTWQKYAFKNQWRGPRFMPAFAVRLFGKVKSVRPERVQEITEAECYREGIVRPSIYDEVSKRGTLYLFQLLWDAINAERGFSWENNPWVWRLQWELITSTGLQVEAKN